MDATIETVRAWLSTGILGSILIVLLRYGRPLIDFWIERKKLDIQEKSQTSQDRRAEEKSRHDMTIGLLEAARREAAQLESKIEQIGFDQGYVIHMDEALRHIEAMVTADNDTDLRVAIRLARAFLNRMKRLVDARGTQRNEDQRAQSAESLHQRQIEGPKGEGGDNPR